MHPETYTDERIVKRGFAGASSTNMTICETRNAIMLSERIHE